MTVNEHLKTVLKRYQDQVEFSYLFGSTSREQERPLSDIDIAVFVSDQRKGTLLDLKLSLYADFCRVLKRNDIDVLVLNTATNTILLENIIKEGMVLSETEKGKLIRKDFELKIRHQAIDFRTQREKIMGV